VEIRLSNNAFLVLTFSASTLDIVYLWLCDVVTRVRLQVLIPHLNLILLDPTMMT